MRKIMKWDLFLYQFILSIREKKRRIKYHNIVEIMNIPLI